jgi:hypothetical protein
MLSAARCPPPVVCFTVSSACCLLHVGCRTLAAARCLPTSALGPATGPGFTLPHLRFNSARPGRICSANGLPTATSPRDCEAFLLEQLRWPLPHLLHWDWLSVATFAARTANEHCPPPPFLPPHPLATSSTLEARRARSCHVCAGTDGLTCHITSTTRLGSLSRRTGGGPSSPTRLAPPIETEDGAYPCHICNGIGLTPCHGTGLCPAT